MPQSIKTRNKKVNFNKVKNNLWQHNFVRSYLTKSSYKKVLVGIYLFFRKRKPFFFLRQFEKEGFTSTPSLKKLTAQTLRRATPNMVSRSGPTCRVVFLTKMKNNLDFIILLHHDTDNTNI